MQKMHLSLVPLMLPFSSSGELGLLNQGVRHPANGDSNREPTGAAKHAALFQSQNALKTKNGQQDPQINTSLDIQVRRKHQSPRTEQYAKCEPGVHYETEYSLLR